MAEIDSREIIIFIITIISVITLLQSFIYLQPYPGSDTGVGRTRDKIALISGLSSATYARAKKVIEVADDKTKQRLRAGKTSIFREYQKIISDEKREGLIAKSISTPDSLENIELIHSDFRDISSKAILDNSIDLIFTDPPYAIKFLQLYKDLGTLAMQVLKEGGSLICYCGTYAIPQILEYMKELGLSYHWIIAVKLQGSFVYTY